MLFVATRHPFRLVQFTSSRPRMLEAKTLFWRDVFPINAHSGCACTTKSELCALALTPNRAQTCCFQACCPFERNQVQKWYQTPQFKALWDNLKNIRYVPFFLLTTFNVQKYRCLPHFFQVVRIHLLSNTGWCVDVSFVNMKTQSTATSHCML